MGLGGSCRRTAQACSRLRARGRAGENIPPVRRHPLIDLDLDVDIGVHS